MAPSQDGEGYVPVDGEPTNSAVQAHLPEEQTEGLGPSKTHLTTGLKAQSQSDQKSEAARRSLAMLNEVPSRMHNKRLRDLYGGADVHVSNRMRSLPSYRGQGQQTHGDDQDTERGASFQIPDRPMVDGAEQVAGQDTIVADGIDGGAEEVPRDGAPPMPTNEAQPPRTRGLDDTTIRPPPRLQDLLSPYPSKPSTSSSSSDQQTRRQSWNTVGSNAWDQALDDVSLVLPFIAKPLHEAKSGSSPDGDSPMGDGDGAHAAPKTKEASTSLGISEDVEMPGLIPGDDMPLVLPYVSGDSHDGVVPQIPVTSRNDVYASLATKAARITAQKTVFHVTAHGPQGPRRAYTPLGHDQKESVAAALRAWVGLDGPERQAQAQHLLETEGDQLYVPTKEETGRGALDEGKPVTQFFEEQLHKMSDGPEEITEAPHTQAPDVTVGASVPATSAGPAVPTTAAADDVAPPLAADGVPTTLGAPGPTTKAPAMTPATSAPTQIPATHAPATTAPATTAPATTAVTTVGTTTPAVHVSAAAEAPIPTSVPTTAAASGAPAATQLARRPSPGVAAPAAKRARTSARRPSVPVLRTTSAPNEPGISVAASVPSVPAGITSTILDDALVAPHGDPGMPSMAFPSEDPPQVPILNWTSTDSPPVSPLERSAEAEDPIHLLSASALSSGQDTRSAAVRDELLHYAHYLYSKSVQQGAGGDGDAVPQTVPALKATRAWQRRGVALHPTLLPLLHALSEMHPEHLPTLLLLSCTYYSAGNLAASLWYNNRILRINPHYVEAMSNIGTALRALGYAREAETWWWRALQLLPGYWDAFENLLGVLCAPASSSADAAHAETRAPPFATALRLCEFVEAHIIPTRRTLVADEGRGPRAHAGRVMDKGSAGMLEAQPFPPQLPLSQLPRVQNLFYAKGNLKYVLEGHGIASAAEEYQRAVEVLFSTSGRPGSTVRDVMVGICVVAVLSFGAVIPGRDALLTAAELAAAFGIDMANPAHAAVVTQGQYTRLHPDGVLGLVRDAGDAAVARLLRIGGDQFPVVFLLPDQVALLLRILFAPTHGVLPVVSGVVTSGSRAAQGKSGSGSGGHSASTSMDVVAKQAAQIGSTILLALAKLFQDAATNASGGASRQLTLRGIPPSVSLLLPFYYLALSMNPNASMFNNLGILLSSLPVATTTVGLSGERVQLTGQLLAVRYYAQGLQLDPTHSHLFTNLGSLFKDMGRLAEAIKMYEKAVEFNPSFDVALANLGNAIKDQGRTQDSITYYRRAVEANPHFPEALCGLVNALLAVCDWGDVYRDAPSPHAEAPPGWMRDVTGIVARQLDAGARYGRGAFRAHGPLERWVDAILGALGDERDEQRTRWTAKLRPFYAEEEAQRPAAYVNEGGFLLRIMERLMRRTQHRWYHDLYTRRTATEGDTHAYERLALPPCLPIPSIPTVLPFHTFTYPLTPRQVRLISHRNALRTSYSVLSQMWLPHHVYPPPPPPAHTGGRIQVGYVSSDFNNHPLAHLMQSVFGFHDTRRFGIHCYATTPSDHSPYREKIEQEAEHFLDVSAWPTERILQQIQHDQVHILVNLNGYTKGARNDIFAARPCPVQMQFMGFAGEMAAGWIDWLVVDPIVCPPSMTSTYRWRERSYDAAQGTFAENATDLAADLDPEDTREDWVYTERIIYMPHSYFVNDHAQGFRDPAEERRIQSVNEEKGMLQDGEDSQRHEADKQQHTAHPPDAHTDGTARDRHDAGAATQAPSAPSAPPDNEVWEREEMRRWRMRKEVFPELPDDYVIFADFNQLYKTDPELFKAWLRILQRVPKSILWLLRFPASGETHLHQFATEHAGPDVAKRVLFTDVAPKHIHIYRGRIADLFLDTNECNAHTTAADILWSGTPLLTWPKYVFKMCSRVAASILHAAGIDERLVVHSEEAYVDRAVELAQSIHYTYEEVSSQPNGRIDRRPVDHRIADVPPSQLTDDMLTVKCTEQTVKGTMQVASHPPYPNTPTLFRRGHGELMDLRRRLFLARDRRDKCPLFDTRGWTRALEAGYQEAWRRWTEGTDTEDTPEWQALPRTAPEKLSSHIWLTDDSTSA
ncbi:hypothetical protein MBRA1_003349 [Malassezia brasiliensis]|uniref:protein O-GlcNAc transferase n=1 Tax=Malassezia brasiliensis TaxID=1821822 RepID=A0AAF0DXC9_9BASI|nr:hypothetical protein MBRA1_003349 [Malassezia brasiliensis]